MSNPFDFVTNDSAIGQRLKGAADRYLEARFAARHLALAEKITAFRDAKRVYEAEIGVILASMSDGVER